MKSKELKETKKLGVLTKAKKYYGEHKKEINKCLILGLNIFVAVVIPFLLMSNTALAATPTPTVPPEQADAFGKWDKMIDFITPWIKKLGGLILLFGVIQTGLGFKQDDSDGMTRGGKTVIAGCIVYGVGAAAKTFLG